MLTGKYGSVKNSVSLKQQQQLIVRTIVLTMLYKEKGKKKKLLLVKIRRMVTVITKEYCFGNSIYICNCVKVNPFTFLLTAHDRYKYVLSQNPLGQIIKTPLISWNGFGFTVKLIQTLNVRSACGIPQ